MAGNIYLINSDKTLQPMVEQPYESEDVLQQLLEQYPELLAGDQIDTAAPRRLLLVSREIGVPGEEEGFDRWSLDHLFIDQDGVPTLVEVEREDLVRGFQHAKDKYVPVTEEELESLEAEVNKSIDLKEVHPACFSGSGLLREHSLSRRLKEARTLGSAGKWLGRC